MLAENLSPVEHHLELYMVSFEGDPYFHAKASNVFGSISIGDYLDHRTFDQLPVKVASGSALRVSEVEHIIWQIAGSHFGHKQMVTTVVELRN